MEVHAMHFFLMFNKRRTYTSKTNHFYFRIGSYFRITLYIRQVYAPWKMSPLSIELAKPAPERNAPTTRPTPCASG